MLNWGNWIKTKNITKAGLLYKWKGITGHFSYFEII